MATISKIQTPAGVRYVADFYDESGRRTRTFFENKHEASAYMHARAQEIVHFRLYGERVRKSSNPLFSDFAARYLETAAAGLRPSSLRRAKLCAARLVKHLGHRRLLQLCEEDVSAYRMARQRDGVSRSTVNRELITLKAILRHAVDAGERSHVLKIKLDDPRKSLAAPRFLSRREFDRLVGFADADLASLITVAVHTGLRKGELFRLTWADVDLENRVATIRETKSGWPRTVPLNSAACDALTSILKDIQTPHVFAWWHRMSGTQGVRRRFDTALKRAGISAFRFHDMRHTFASWAVVAGVDLRTVAQWLGHRSLDLVMRYTHLAPSHEREMIERLSRGNRAVTGQWKQSSGTR